MKAGRPRRRSAPAPRRGSLVVVGTGITGVGQMTAESIDCVRRADRLYYLVVDPLTEMWLRATNPTATTLADLYGPDKRRRQTYAEMTRRIVDSVRNGDDVCVAFYGHPGILARAPHDAIRQLRREGYDARMLPGISADGCLFADVGVDPGDRGVQSYEATAFLYWKNRIDPTANLILWQAGVLGEMTARKDRLCPPDRLRTLCDALRRWYPDDHQVVLYEAAASPLDPPRIRRVTLARLPRAALSPIVTLLVPALPQARRPDRVVKGWVTA